MWIKLYDEDFQNYYIKRNAENLKLLGTKETYSIYHRIRLAKTEIGKIPNGMIIKETEEIQKTRVNHGTIVCM